jgi:hypothetical protein
MTLLSAVFGRADEAEDRAAEPLQKRFVGVERDEHAKGKPVIKVDCTVAMVTDAELRELVAFKKLKELSLWSCPVTDAGMKELAALPNLQVSASKPRRSPTRA